MANTTNYNWETPDDTDLVKDGAAAIRTLGSSIDTTTKALNPSTTLGDIEYRSATANTNTRLGIGTTGQVLTVADGVPTWATSDDANAIQNAIVDAKGDIVAASAADTPARLAVGTDNQRLVAASGETTGLKYVSDTQNTVIDAEGDLLVGDAADALQRLAVGTTGQVLTVDTAVDGKIKWATPAAATSGLTKVASGTFSVSATNVAVDSCFNATYKNYKVIFTITAATASPARWGLFMRLRTGGSDNTNNNYRYNNNQYDWSSGALEQDKNEDVSSAYVTSLDNGLTQLTFEVTNPYASNVTWVQGVASNKTAGGFANFMFNATTSFDGFKIQCDQASQLTGEYAVYGYEN